MAQQQFDPAKYKTKQLEDWEKAAAAWKKWWPLTEKGAQPLSDYMVNLAGIKPGQSVLDVATGLGEPAVTAAKKVGRSGKVVATDQSPAMLAYAQERAAQLGLKNMQFRAMDAESLDLPDSSFDVVLSRWGLMFLADLRSALARIHRLLAPGGRLVAAVWSTPEKAPLLSLPFRVASQKLDLPPPPPDAPGPFSLADVSKLEIPMREVGFKSVRSQSFLVSYELPSIKTYIEMVSDMAAPLRGLLADRPKSVGEDLWLTIEEEAGRFATPGGAIDLTNEAIVTVGER
jgi:SAM-dependent methyltransferase